MSFTYKPGSPPTSRKARRLLGVISTGCSRVVEERVEDGDIYLLHLELYFGGLSMVHIVAFTEDVIYIGFCV